MNIQEVQQLLDSSQIDKLKEAFEVERGVRFIKQAMGLSNLMCIPDNEQLDPALHKVQRATFRNNKIIKGDKGAPDTVVRVNRISLPEQKKIVRIAAAFLGTPSIEGTTTNKKEEELLVIIKRIHAKNKLQYQFKDLVTTTMSERECAELWYGAHASDDYWDGTALKGKKVQLRSRILSQSRGDTSYPAFDGQGDMVAFGRYYKAQVISTTTYKHEVVEHFDVYTAQWIYYFEKSGSSDWMVSKIKDETGAEVDGKIQNVVGKIPIMYYCQPITEWGDVQDLIERLEVKTSNHADTNDYFDSPIVFAEGDVQGFTNKGEQGKVLTGTGGAKVSYLTWDQAPESMKMEIENLRAYINKYTHTPDISFDNLKGIGQLSGFAMEFFFMDAHMKAAEHEQQFGAGVQRRINYLTTAVVKLAPALQVASGMDITPKFTYFLPQDIDGKVGTIIKAKNAGIMSLQTAVEQNPLIKDKEGELVRIKQEAVEAARLAAEAAKAAATLPGNNA